MSNFHSYECLLLLLDSVYFPLFLCSLNASVLCSVLPLWYQALFPYACLVQRYLARSRCFIIHLTLFCTYICSTEHCKGNKTVPKTVTTTRTEDGHRQNTKPSSAIQTERKKEHRATEEQMERPTSSGGLRNRPKPSRT
jgi:hypothetical protein